MCSVHCSKVTIASSRSVLSTLSDNRQGTVPAILAIPGTELGIVCSMQTCALPQSLGPLEGNRGVDGGALCTSFWDTGLQGVD